MSYSQLAQMLEEQFEWPGPYLFKFVVPAAKESDVRALLGDAEITTRASKNGTYVSVSATVTLDSPRAVVEVYLRAEKIDGLLSI